MQSKLMKTREAVTRFIKPGMHVGFGGFSLCRNAMSVSHEIIRQGIGNLHVSSVNPAYGVDILIGAGLVRSVESGCLNMERLGLPRNFCRAVESGSLKSEDFEHLGMTMRYLAGALGISFIPTKAELGSDIVVHQALDAKKVHIGPCPFTGETYAILPACTPDVAVVFATQADEFGNTQIQGTAFADEFIAKASHQIIVVAEQIVTTEEIRQKPQDTLIPSYRVNALIHEPWGAHPTASPGHYDYDYEALQEYQQAARDVAAFKAYIQKYILDVKDFKEYLDKALTPSRMQRLRYDPRLGYSSEIAEVVTCGGFTGDLPDECTRNEMMIVAAARQIREGEVTIVGTGLPMAATALAMNTHAPNLNYIVETGIGDLMPVHASLSVADTRLLGAAKPSFVRNILEALGFLVQKGLADLGFLGGAQIDMYGNLNATCVGDYAKPKKRFPGSGGANPIASCAKRVLIIIRHEKRRFLERVEYITSPGHLQGGDSRRAASLRGGGPDRVITDLGIMDFEPASKRMRVISLHPGVTREKIQEATGFPLLFAPEVAETPPPSPEELNILRTKIGRVYLGGE
jgi:acyl CoA:acetate/3-ketoacid CoA transferase alpha subunit/acyl CoA:acetate/3-ketoacid CoA transferase beta subunit